MPPPDDARLARVLSSPAGGCGDSAQRLIVNKIIRQAQGLAADLQRALSEKEEWLDLFPDCVRMFDCTYRWLASFFLRAEPRETVYVIVGDHKPVSSVTGESASWDVPVHVVSRDPALLQRFVALGFHPGLQAPRLAVAALHEFTGLMLCAFSSQPLAAGDQVAKKRLPC